eukprot:m.9331 g.9331  ORF g.9331 m.9331 type:complete len:71 (+) comp5441_c0_seq1:867-1079(+)
MKYGMVSNERLHSCSDSQPRLDALKKPQYAAVCTYISLHLHFLERVFITRIQYRDDWRTCCCNACESVQK